jgi:hypothetical protein
LTLIAKLKSCITLPASHRLFFRRPFRFFFRRPEKIQGQKSTNQNPESFHSGTGSRDLVNEPNT